MSSFVTALSAERLKIRHTGITWGSFIAFAIAPLMGGVFMLMMQNPEAMEKAGILSAKVEAMGFSADWASYFLILNQAMGVGGILIFGFVASWVFGREYSDGTAKDLLALPSSRSSILNAKFVIYVLWCMALAFINLMLTILIALLFQLPLSSSSEVYSQLYNYLLTSILTIVLGTPIALFALWGKGYLMPLAFVALTLVFAQIIAATGFGNYFPWAVPGIFSGISQEYKAQLNFWSFFAVGATGVVGYLAALLYWNLIDHEK